jgi:hypothetical protein
VQSGLQTSVEKSIPKINQPAASDAAARHGSGEGQNDMKSAKLVELIETATLRGTGKDGDVCRNVTQWWTKEGDLLVERDEWKMEQDAQRFSECAGLNTILDDQLGKEQEPVGLRTRVLAAAVGCKKWLEHEVQTSINAEQKRLATGLKTMCTKSGCCNPRQLYSKGNYSKLCREHNEANARRQREARERSVRRPKK